jgi:hypothetical protein
MTMVLTDEQHTIVSHFTRHMPLGVRARYEAQVREMLKRNAIPNENSKREEGTIVVPFRHGDDEVMQATRVCIDVMWMMWSQARLRYQPPFGVEKACRCNE